METELSGRVYRIPDHLRIGSLFISDWGSVYTALRESDTLCSSSPVQLCTASAGDTKWIRYNPYPFCFTYKHRNPIRNAPKPRFDNRIASTQMRLTIAWQIGKENNKYGGSNEIILTRNGATGLFSRLLVNTHTLERFLYRIQESDPA